MNDERSSEQAAIALSVVLLGIFFSANLPWIGHQNALQALENRPGSSLIALLHFGMPLVAAAITISRRMRGRIPQRASFWMMAFPELAKALAALIALATLVLRGDSKAAAIASAGLLLLFALLLTALWRGRVREGWSRWAHLLAAMVPWHAFVAVALLLERGGSSLLLGPKLYLAATMLAFPLMGWVLWPRRGSKEFESKTTSSPSIP